MNIQTAISNYGPSLGGNYTNSYGSFTSTSPSPASQSVEINSIDRSGEVRRAGSLTEPSNTNQANRDTDQDRQGQAPESRSVQGSGDTETAQLTQEELKLLSKLKQIDTKVRSHEMAHVAAGGSYITSGASYTYQKGPDGKNYAVGGEVSIDTAPVPGDPEATIQKMKQVQRAALAPGDPSSQDRKVAANAASQALKATAELTMLMAKDNSESNETQALGNNKKNAANAYSQVAGLPETEESSFKFAV